MSTRAWILAWIGAILAGWGLTVGMVRAQAHLRQVRYDQTAQADIEQLRAERAQLMSALDKAQAEALRLRTEAEQAAFMRVGFDRLLLACADR